jgi:hypothetical protein
VPPMFCDSPILCLVFAFNLLSFFFCIATLHISFLLLNLLQNILRAEAAYGEAKKANSP